MNRSANITSVDAVREFKLALLDFEDAVRDALTQLDLEVRRANAWIEVDRAQYWPRELRRASDAVNEARINLNRKEISPNHDHVPASSEERKVLEKAKRRLDVAEQKVRAVRRWRPKIKHDVEEFQVQTAKMNHYLDSVFPNAVARLERISVALDKYVARSSPTQTTAADAAESGASPVTDQSAAEREEP